MVLPFVTFFFRCSRHCWLSRCLNLLQHLATLITIKFGPTDRETNNRKKRSKRLRVWMNQSGIICLKAVHFWQTKLVRKYMKKETNNIGLQGQASNAANARRVAWATPLPKHLLTGPFELRLTLGRSPRLPHVMLERGHSVSGADLSLGPVGPFFASAEAPIFHDSGPTVEHSCGAFSRPLTMQPAKFVHDLRRVSIFRHIPNH